MATRTIWAAGGINASLGTLDPEDRWGIHEAVTMREGDFVCDPRTVELLAENAPDRVLEPAETTLRSAPCEKCRVEHTIARILPRRGTNGSKTSSVRKAKTARCACGPPPPGRSPKRYTIPSKRSTS
jgi:succinate dehydrogenase/fumarate reductase flavoprotein subunit